MKLTVKQEKLVRIALREYKRMLGKAPKSTKLAGELKDIDALLAELTEADRLRCLPS